jgi:hypothetical protein
MVIRRQASALPRRSRSVSHSPPNVPSRGTRLAEFLLECEAEAIMRKMIDKAKQGDMAAMRWCLERLPRCDRSGRFHMPIPLSAADACKSLGAITSAVGQGELTPAEAAALATVVEKFVKIFETAEIERRVQALEQKQGNQGAPFR